MTAAPRRLLAKAASDPTHPDESSTLEGHSLATLRAGERILDVVATDALVALGLDEAPWGLRLREAVRRACFSHDLGKANTHFQTLVRGGGRTSPQAYRHEQVGVWLLAEEGPLATWMLGDAEECVRLAILCAVGAHHLKFDTARLEYGPPPAPALLTILAGHPDFAATLTAGSVALGLGEPPSLSDRTVRSSDDALCESVAFTCSQGIRNGGPLLRRFIGVVKSLTLVADVVASASIDVDDRLVPLADWIRTALDSTCTEALLAEVASRRLGGRAPRRFQMEVGGSRAPVTLVRAGCGSGKTVAAYLWGAHHAVGRKLFVCYPTTGTATEGFADHLLDLGIGRLVHSRADVDRGRLGERTGDPVTVGSRAMSGEEGLAELADDWAALDRTLRVWSDPVIVCTVDAVLGVLQNHRSGHFALPALLRSAVVFDEIHQYGERLFAALVGFLEAFPGIPVLLMTASLQPARRVALEGVCARRGMSMPVIDGPADLQSGDRYQIERAEVEPSFEAAIACARSGGKVLWVANTVLAAMGVAQRLECLGLSPITYHSRFRYVDRVDRHETVIRAFRDGAGVIAVTTQVCEVSLDLSADLLVTELAPAPALVQRLGRLNRRFDPARPETRCAMVIEPVSHLPYSALELSDARVWLDAVTGKPVSQSDLARAYEEIAPTEETGNTVDLVWLMDQPFATPAPLRDADTTVQVLLDVDAEACTSHRNVVNGAEVVRRSIPMPLGTVAREVWMWQRLGMAFVAPPNRIEYSARLGARWAS
ncbi:MAG: CRISPR-associated helicase Cas3' [Chloroflexi bacterium]|nr:CRISPR-associated helicase Cas3' [Chloroflexota bacterium]